MSTMARRARRKFTPEFKAETVKLVRESGKTVGEVARELDLTETALRDRRRHANRGFRQGKRKTDKWGPCKQCGLPAAFRCDRCGNWRCFGSWVVARQMAILREGASDFPVEHVGSSGFREP